MTSCNRNICKLGKWLYSVVIGILLVLTILFVILPLTALSAVFVWPFLKVNDIDYNKAYIWQEWYAWRPVILDDEFKYFFKLAWFKRIRRSHNYSHTNYRSLTK